MPLRVRTSLVLVLILAWSGLARADKEEAGEHSSRAQAHLRTSEFELAIEEFERAYAAYPSAQFLYNMAQIQRKNLDQCQPALRSYRRFLASAPFASEALRKAEMVARKYQSLLSARCPEPSEPSGDPARSDPPRAAGVHDGEMFSEPVAPARTHGLAADHAAPSDPKSDLRSGAGGGGYDYGIEPLRPIVRIDGGGNQYRLGDVDVPITGSIRATLGWPLGIDEFPLRGLLSVGTSPMRYRGSESGVALFVPVMVGLELATATEGVSLDAALEVGGLGIYGLAEGNPISMDGKAMDSSWSTAINARVGLSVPVLAAWSVNGGLELGTASRPDGFASDIGSILMFGLTAGLSREL